MKLDGDALGRLVRDTWVAWAREQPDVADQDLELPRLVEHQRRRHRPALRLHLQRGRHGDHTMLGRLRTKDHALVIRHRCGFCHRPDTGRMWWQRLLYTWRTG